MATWAYECRRCDGDDVWWLARERVDEWPAAVCIVRVKTGSGWDCARIVRRRLVEVDAMLLREAVASDAEDCPQCAERPEPAAPPPAAEPEPTEEHAVTLQAADLWLQGRHLMVVLVGLDLVQSPGEADMLAADLRVRFGGVDVVLMGQQEDGTPQYHGDAGLVALLAGMAVDQLPWKGYPVA